MDLHSILRWLKEKLPSFDSDIDKVTRRNNITKYTTLCFIFSTTLICIILPLWYSFSITYTFFKIDHRLKHHIFKRGSLFHRIPLYHNKSLQLCLFWCTVCFTSVLYSSQRDLKQISKRLGRVAVALMPPLLFLTLRPSPLPQTLYLRILPIHKWISRVVVLASFLHCILYAYLMISQKVFWHVMLMFPYVTGALAMMLFILIGITSIRKIRRRNFKLFYYVHYNSTWLVVLLIYLHARPSVPYYTTLSFSILLYQIGYRVYHTSLIRATVTVISPSITLFEFPAENLAKKPILPSGHVRINIYHKNFIKRLFFKVIPFQHPYTIASLPNEDTVKLIIRNGRFSMVNNGQYYITGSFEPILNFIEKPKDIEKHLASQRNNSNPFRINSSGLVNSPLYYVINARKVLLCVGGSAISFGLPLLRVLNFNGVMVRLIWAIRDYRDLKLLEYFKNNFEGIEIYISGGAGSEQDIELDYDDRTPDMPGEVSRLSNDDENCPLRSISDIGYGTIRSDHDNENNDDQAADEVDFTNTFSLRPNRSLSQLRYDNKLEESKSKRAAGSAFRKPMILEASYAEECLCNPGGVCDVEALEVCDQPDKKIKVPSGVKIYYGRPTLNKTDYEWCLEQECDDNLDTDQCCQNKYGTGIGADVERLAQVWVIAAGPDGLVENTRHWAIDGGLHFHAESFAV